MMKRNDLGQRPQYENVRLIVTMQRVFYDDRKFFMWYFYTSHQFFHIRAWGRTPFLPEPAFSSPNAGLKFKNASRGLLKKRKTILFQILAKND